MFRAYKLLLVFLVINNYLSGQNVIQQDNEIKNCTVSIICLNENVNLGNFYNGYQGSEIPGIGGNTNSIEYLILGDAKKKYIVNATFQRNKSNEIVIDAWTWKINDKNNLNYSGQHYTNIINFTTSLSLIPDNENRCYGTAKIKLEFQHISISENAKPGNNSFFVSINIFEDNY